jgi:transposase InsO family protein
MDIHKNARLTPLGREHMVNMVLSGQTPKAVGEAVGVCPRTVRKWIERYQAEGLAGLQDRSSRPQPLRQPTSQATVDRIEALRRQRMTGKAIAAETGVSPATVSRVLKRLGLNRLSALEPAEPPRRYQRERPGELIHIDIKKLGRFDRTGHRITGRQTGIATSRGSGWEFLHVAIDDASRIAFSRIMKTERKACAVAFLKAAVAYYASLGVTVERVMTDNGSCYRSRRFRNACRRLSLKLIYTRPYTPRTNGKAEPLHPDSLARMGLCQGLRHLTATRRRAASLDTPIQLASTSWQHWHRASHQHSRSNRE